jgi:hypothetical protein
MGEYTYSEALSGSGWDYIRTPSVFKTASASAAGNTALWTPASGKKFRLMQVGLQVTANAATTGGAVITIDLKDGANNSTGVTFSVFVPSVAGTTLSTGPQVSFIKLGNGILSALASNVLNINLSAALTSGVCRILAAGTEE